MLRLSWTAVAVVISGWVLLTGCGDDGTQPGGSSSQGGGGGDIAGGAGGEGVSGGGGGGVEGGAAGVGGAGGGGGGGTGPTGCVFFVDGAQGDDAADGQSWSSARATVNAGLDAAEAARDPDGCQVWVRAGTYFPSASGDRTASFQLRVDIPLYGGFAGDEDALDQRDPAANETVLSGDIGVASVRADNSYHVVLGADGARLDGFTVRDGFADGGAGQTTGAGLYSEAATLTVSNCRFEANGTGDAPPPISGSIGTDAGAGGAIFHQGGLLTIELGVFEANFTGSGSAGSGIGGNGGYGAAIAVSGAGSLDVSGSTFVGNTTGAGGGTLATSGGLGGGGGPGAGIGFSGMGLLTVTASTFTDNTTGAGGPSVAPSGGIAGSGGIGAGIAVPYQGSLRVFGSTFQGNKTGDGAHATGAIAGSGGGGAGIAFNSAGSFEVRGSSFVDNLTGDGGDGGDIAGSGGDGAGVYITTNPLGTGVVIATSTFSGNQAGGSGTGTLSGLAGGGSALYVNPSGAGPIVVVSSSFDHNSGSSGGAVLLQAEGATAPVVLANDVFWQNHASGAGGAVVYRGNGMGSFLLVASTFEGNSAGVEGGGISFRGFEAAGAGPLRVTSSVFWNNVAPTGAGLAYTNLSFTNETVLAVDHNDLQGGCDSANTLLVCDTNLVVDPAFVDAPAGNLALMAASPLRDAGDAGGLPSDLADVDFDGDLLEAVPLDRNGAARVSGGELDIGAFELP